MPDYTLSDLIVVATACLLCRYAVGSFRDRLKSPRHRKRAVATRLSDRLHPQFFLCCHSPASVFLPRRKMVRRIVSGTLPG